MNHTAFELLSSPKEIAFISVDNTQGFENQALQELYVSEGEQAAQGSKAVVDLCKGYGISLINVFDSHPRGHLLFSQNYKDKKPFEMISYEEVKAWTPEEHGLSQRAGFGLSELQSHLQKVGQEMLWPDHCIQGTQGAQLMPPLEESDFDFHLPKGTAPVSSGYSGFEQTVLDNILKEQGKKVLLLWGVATDYCIGQTALDAKKLGYQPYLICEAIRGVAQETTQKMLFELQNKHIELLTHQELMEILSKKFNS